MLCDGVATVAFMRDPNASSRTPRAPQSIWDAFWGVPMVDPIGIGTGTTQRLQVMVADLILLIHEWAEERVSPSFVMLVSIPLLGTRRFGSDCPGNCRCRYTPNTGHLFAAALCTGFWTRRVWPGETGAINVVLANTEAIVFSFSVKSWMPVLPSNSIRSDLPVTTVASNDLLEQ
jgi:hypothetical protein